MGSCSLIHSEFSTLLPTAISPDPSSFFQNLYRPWSLLLQFASKGMHNLFISFLWPPPPRYGELMAEMWNYFQPRSRSVCPSVCVCPPVWTFWPMTKERQSPSSKEGPLQVQWICLCLWNYGAYVDMVAVNQLLIFIGVDICSHLGDKKEQGCINL